MPRVFVAAGSNVRPEEHLAKASRELAREFPDVQFSPWYRNRAVGFEGEDFINFVVGFHTELPVREVLARLHTIEERCGRPRNAPKWAPRTMDLDILLYGDVVCEEPGLKLPRPDLLRRAFMLGPLADIAPEVVHPTEKLTIEELWQRFDRAAHPMTQVPAATSSHSDPRPPQGSGP
jgi:2-amino-4-hydroxy-6-hydroxymethyldihydropteridine diphosphokinase